MSRAQCHVRSTTTHFTSEPSVAYLDNTWDKINFPSGKHSLADLSYVKIGGKSLFQNFFSDLFAGIKGASTFWEFLSTATLICLPFVEFLLIRRMSAKLCEKWPNAVFGGHTSMPSMHVPPHAHCTQQLCFPRNQSFPSSPLQRGKCPLSALGEHSSLFHCQEGKYSLSFI